jgi:hypothetical protein
VPFVLVPETAAEPPLVLSYPTTAALLLLVVDALIGPVRLALPATLRVEPLS